MCAKPETRPEIATSRKFDARAALLACLVEGDAGQRARARAVRRRSLIFSVVAQVAILAALILVPILSKTEPIAMASVMQLPAYRPATGVHDLRAVPRNPSPPRGFPFCLRCPPVAPRPVVRSDLQSRGDSSGFAEEPTTDPADANCPACRELAVGTRPQPLAPPDNTPRRVQLTHIDPAMLLHRVEPVFPVLARQIRREGTVELHAIIAADGSVQALEVLQGDSWFFPSALEAVRQWRYRPTFLNGRAVEVDTHITVIYKLAR